MKYFLICVIFLQECRCIHAQNLVSNGGFEDVNWCTEFDKDCAPEAWIATSLYFNYYFDATQTNAAKAHTGNRYVGLTACNMGMAGIRNFIRTRLLCGLRKGHQYQLEFYCRSQYPVLDSIGIYFCPNDFLYEKRYFKMLQPQLWSVDGLPKPAPGPTVWQKVHLIYTADGTEGYVTIGNFKHDDYKNLGQPGHHGDYYFFLDDVSLTPVDSNETLCPQADSVRKEIYAENERHSYLERKVATYRQHPPSVMPLPLTAEKRPPVPVFVQTIDTLIIPDIFFATGSYELNKNSFHLLDSFASKLVLPHIDSLVIEGHTDSIGKLAYNQALSFNRAESVKNYLTGKVAGLSEKSITRGFAYLRPVATNKTPRGRQLNRRVEVFLYRREVTGNRQ